MKRAYSIIVICQACAAVAAVAALKALAVYVTPETFGQYSLYQSVVAAASLFLVSWPNAAVLRFGREEWTRHGRVGVTVAARLTLFVASVSVATAIGWIADPWLRGFLKIPTSPFYWIVAGVIVIPAAELAIYISQAVGRSEAYGYSPLVTRGGFLVGVVLIPLLHRDVTWTYLAACMVGATTAATATTVVKLPMASWSGFRMTSPALVAVLRYSWTIPFAAMSAYIVNWVDSWVIRGFRGVGPVGIYNWAYQTTAIASLACAPIAAILTPRVIDARLNADRERINRYARSILPVTAIASVAVAVGLTAVFPLLRIVASPAYAESYPVILVLMAAFPFQLLGYLVTPLGNAYESLIPRFVFVSAAVALFNTAGDLVLVPRMGISGAAISTAVAFAFGGVLQAVVVRSCANFHSMWRYTAPAWILVPTVAALCWAGPVMGAMLVLAGVVGTVGIYYVVLVWGTSSPINRRAGFHWLMGLPRALTLSDVTPWPEL